MKKTLKINEYQISLEAMNPHNFDPYALVVRWVSGRNGGRGIVLSVRMFGNESEAEWAFDGCCRYLQRCVEYGREEEFDSRMDRICELQAEQVGVSLAELWDIWEERGEA